MFLANFLYRKLKGYHLLIVITIAVTFAQVATDIFSAFPLKFIIDKVVYHIDPSFPGADILFHPFASFQIGGVQLGVVVFSAIMLIVLGFLGAILSYIQLYLAAFIAKNLTSRLSRQLFDHLQRLSVSWHDKEKPGDLVQRITGNISDLEKFVADGMIDLLAGILTLLGVIVVMLIASVPFTLLSIMIVPILFSIVLTYTRSIKAATRKEKQAEGEVSNIATEAMAKIMEIKAFTLEGFMFWLFNSHTQNRIQAGMRAGSLQAQFTPLVDIVLAIGTAIIVGIGAYVAICNLPGATCGRYAFESFLNNPAQKSFTLGTLTVFLAYLGKLYQPMRDISKLTTLATSASSAAERIQDVLNQKPENLETPPRPVRLKGSITYEGVYFLFNPPPAELVLKDITLHIPAGQKVAIVGLSGSGKTTMTKLLPRFYEAPWGSVKVDGVDVRQYPLAVLRQNISVVFQNSILFEGTIRENIRLGCPQASDKEIVQAAEQACIHETIMKKLGGYDAQIIGHGKNLSGGQRQRIAIARAILRDAPIVILDEPTASLDVESEAEVMRALYGLGQGRTVLMITHRLSTIGKVDEIIVLRDGKIVEQGTYRELKKKDNGVFANLLKAQEAPDIDPESNDSIIRTYSDSSDILLPKAQVLIEIDGKLIDTHLLDKRAVTVGRNSGNDIEIQSPLVSRLHAKILWQKGTWLIKDAPSTNGLHYNGKRVDQHIFANRDRIYLARTPTSIVALQYQTLP